MTSAGDFSTGSSESRPRHEERIVVVSADPGSPELFREMMGRKGYEVTYLTKAREVVNLIQNGTVVDALLLDLALPDLPWRELLNIVKTGLQDAPVVVTADPAEMPEAIQALHEGAFDYLVKPLRSEELDGVLLRALREKERRAEQRLPNPAADEARGSNHRLDQTVKELSLLFRVSQLLAITDDLSSLMSDLVETLADALQVERVSLLLLTPDEEALEVRASHGLPPEGRHARVPLGDWVAGRVLRDALPIRVGDIASELHRPSRQGYRTGACLVVPLYAGVQPIGVLAFSDPIGRTSFTDDEMGLALSVARMAAPAITVRELASSNALQLNRIKHLESFVRNLLEHLPGGVMTVDAPGTVTYLNPRGEKILGVQSAEAVGRPYHDVLKSPEGISPLLATLTSVGPLEHEEVSVIGPAGVPVTLDLSTSLWTNDQGEPQGIIIAFSALGRSEIPEKTRRSQTLATLGELSAGLAHEVRNPLAGMLTSAQLIAQRLSENDPCREYANLILEEGQRLEDLIRSLLDFARPSKLNFAECSVHEILDRALSLVKPLIHAQKIQVRRQYVSSVGQILADRQGLLQVFLNVILNAIQAMPQGGVLTLETLTQKEGVTVEIGDTGEGIPPELLARIFDPFFTTKPEGTGLGLALSLKIVSDHGGKVTARSEPGQGSRFILRFPFAPPGTARPSGRNFR